MRSTDLDAESMPYVSYDGGGKGFWNGLMFLEKVFFDDHIKVNTGLIFTTFIDDASYDTYTVISCISLQFYAMPWYVFLMVCYKI